MSGLSDIRERAYWRARSRATDDLNAGRLDPAQFLDKCARLIRARDYRLTMRALSSVARLSMDRLAANARRDDNACAAFALESFEP